MKAYNNKIVGRSHSIEGIHYKMSNIGFFYKLVRMFGIT